MVWGLARNHTAGMGRDLKMHIGVKVKAARTGLGLTQEELAEVVGKAVETISNIERGAMLTGLDTLERIAHALKVPMVYFFEDADDARQVERGRLELEEKLTGITRTLGDRDLKLAISLVQVVSEHQA